MVERRRQLRLPSIVRKLGGGFMAVSIGEYYRYLYEYHHRYLLFFRDYYGVEFIREFAYPFRRMCTTPEQLYRQVLFYGGVEGQATYVTVNGFERFEQKKRKVPVYDTAIIDRVFFDFDSEKVADAYVDAVRLYEHFNEKPTVFFSGKKGFHLMLFLANRTPYSEVVRLVGKVRMLGLVCWENPAEGNYGASQTLDNARVSRIPYTRHQDTGLMMIPVKAGWDVNEIFMEASRPQVPRIVRKEKVDLEGWL